MAVCDIITIGASMGGVEALQSLLAGLPANLQAAVFIVLHIGAANSNLPQILSRCGRLPAMHPTDGQPIVKGTVYVAPPDRHLLLAPDHINLSPGPKENRTRPAVNPLFRSAAWTFGPRVAGVILTGTLDDGTAGLAEIKRRGGVAIVQDPLTAFSPSMPENAIEHVDVDYIVALDEMAALLTRVASQQRKEPALMPDETVEKILSELTCPECRGPLWEERQDRIVEYRCRVGHAYSPLALARDQRETVERSLWSALVALEESVDIAERLAEPGSPLAHETTVRRRQVEAIKKILNEQPAAPSTELNPQSEF
ncbi:MAG TPA: chemotaxis protein CheB [Chthoniobacterales bacterium]